MNCALNCPFSFLSFSVCLWFLCVNSSPLPTFPFGCVFACVCLCSMQAAGWSSCWFSVGSSFPGLVLVTVSATLHPAPSLAKPTTSCQFLKAFLLTVSASFYKTTRSIVYFGVTLVLRQSLSGSTPIISRTLSRPPSTASPCSRTWT